MYHSDVRTNAEEFQPSTMPHRGPAHKLTLGFMRNRYCTSVNHDVITGVGGISESLEAVKAI
jgi:hypothetical protein